MRLVAMMLSCGLGACSGTGSPASPAPVEVHPSEEVATRPETPATGDPATQSFSCPMHPNETAAEASKCSKCGMDMVAAERHDHASHDH